MTNINTNNINFAGLNVEKMFNPKTIFSNNELLERLSANSKLFRNAELCKMGMLNGFYSKYYAFIITDKNLAHTIVEKNCKNVKYLSNELKTNYEFIKELMIANPSNVHEILKNDDVLPNIPCNQEDFFKEMCKLVKKYKFDTTMFHINKYKYEYNDEIASLIIDYLAPRKGGKRLYIDTFIKNNPDFMNNKFIIGLYKKSIEFGNSYKIWRDCDINDELVNAVLDITPNIMFDCYEKLSNKTLIRCISLNAGVISYLVICGPMINVEIVLGIIKNNGIFALSDIIIEKYHDEIIANFPHLANLDNNLLKVIQGIIHGDIKLEHLSDEMRKKYIDATTDFNDEAQMLVLCKKDKSYRAKLGDKLKSDPVFLMKLITELSS